MNNKRSKITVIIVYVLIGALCLFTRIWNICDLPSGYNIDESSMAYDAWCIANYGVDRNLVSMPLWLINYGGGQSPLYCYLCVILFKIFGFHYGLIRVPAIIFSVLTVVFSSLTMREIVKDNKGPQKDYMPVATAILVTICPCFVLLGRIGLDCNLMLGTATIYIYILIKQMSRDTLKKSGYILAGFSGAVVLYSYSLSHIVIPLFLLFTFIYSIRTKKMKIKGWLIMGLTMFILAIPAILEHFVNAFDLGDIHIFKFTIPRMTIDRSREFYIPSAEGFKKLLTSIFVGEGWTVYSSIPGIKNAYSLTVILFAIGFVGVLVALVRSIIKREYKVECIVFFFFLSEFILGLCIDSNVNRINAIFSSVIIIAVYGIEVIRKIGLFIIEKIKLFSKQKGLIRTFATVGLLLVITCVYAKNFYHFSRYYFGGVYSKEYPQIPLFEWEVSEGIKFLEENPQYYGESGHTSTFDCILALSTKTPPYEFASFSEDSYWHPSSWPEIKENMLFIMNNQNVEYIQALKDFGYSEKKFEYYSVFYYE